MEIRKYNILKSFFILISIFSIFFIFLSLFNIKNAIAMMSIEEERQLGDKLLQDVKKQVKIVSDPEIVAVVKRVSDNILKQVDSTYFDFKFYVIEDSSLNAFAMPGGNIFIHTGILENIDTEDDLACVIAHEIGHIQGRHIAKRISTMQKLNIASMAMAVTSLFLGGGGKSSQAVMVGSTALAMSATLKYSRVDEEEADRRAYEWVCNAGYDPYGLINVMRKIIQNRWIGSDSIPSYLSTHPSSSERITYLEQLISLKPCKKIQENRDDESIKRIRIIAQNMGKNPLEQIRFYSQEIKKNPDDIYLNYGLALAYKENRQFNMALDILKKIVKKKGENSVFNLDLAKTYYFSGDYKKAISILQGIKLREDMQVSVNYYLASSLLESGDTYLAIRLFKQIVDNWSEPSDIYLKIGRGYAKISRNGEAHYYFYRHYREIDDIKTALYHKKKAIETLDKESELYRELVREKDKDNENKSS